MNSHFHPLIPKHSQYLQAVVVKAAVEQAAVEEAAVVEVR
jgi:hypothetical protein